MIRCAWVPASRGPMARSYSWRSRARNRRPARGRRVGQVPRGALEELRPLPRAGAALAGEQSGSRPVADGPLKLDRHRGNGGCGRRRGPFRVRLRSLLTQIKDHERLGQPESVPTAVPPRKRGVLGCFRPCTSASTAPPSVEGGRTELLRAERCPTFEYALPVARDAGVHPSSLPTFELQRGVRVERNTLEIDDVRASSRTLCSVLHCASSSSRRTDDSATAVDRFQ